MAVQHERMKQIQDALQQRLQELPREGTDRSMVDALPAEVAASVRPVRKSARALTKEAQDKMHARISKLKPGTQVDRWDVESL